MCYGRGLERFALPALQAISWKKLLGYSGVKCHALKEPAKKSVQPTTEELAVFDEIIREGAKNFIVCWHDQGPLNLCMTAFLAREKRIMLQAMRDPFHRYWNDVSAALISARCYSHYCHSLVFLNIAFGPWSQSAFWEEIQGAAGIASAGMSPNDALLCRMWPQIVQDGLELETETGTHRVEDSVESRSLWLKSLQSMQFLRSKGQKASASRWFSWVESFATLDQQFHSKALVLALICLNKGFVKDFDSLLDDSELTKRKKPNEQTEVVAGSGAVASAASSSDKAPTKSTELQRSKQE
eukprot:6474351-Amphidinium_carterae.1